MAFQGPGEQLKMFMTPREIMGQYQALDGDRRSEGDHLYTARSQNTEGMDNYPRKNADGVPFPDMVTSARPGADPEKPYWYMPAPESDEHLYARKLEEAKMPPEDYQEVHRGGGSSSGRPSSDMSMGIWDRSDAPEPYTAGHTATYEYNMEQFVQDRQDSIWNKQAAYDEKQGGSLYDSIASEGARSPVRLGRTIGSKGKPQIVGGHHRLAAQADINQDQFMPVLHHEDIGSAKNDPYYKYT